MHQIFVLLSRQKLWFCFCFHFFPPKLRITRVKFNSTHVLRDFSFRARVEIRGYIPCRIFEIQDQVSLRNTAKCGGKMVKKNQYMDWSQTNETNQVFRFLFASFFRLYFVVYFSILNFAHIKIFRSLAIPFFLQRCLQNRRFEIHICRISPFFAYDFSLGGYKKNIKRFKNQLGKNNKKK